MTDKNEVVEMLRDLGDKVGKTAEEAWPFLIEHTIVDSWARIIGTVIALLTSSILALWLTLRFKAGKGLDDGLSFGLLLVVPMACLFSFIAIFIEAVPALIKLNAPEGHLIRQLLNK